MRGLDDLEGSGKVVYAAISHTGRADAGPGGAARLGAAHRHAELQAVSAFPATARKSIFGGLEVSGTDR
jgi:hypothetical protein